MSANEHLNEQQFPKITGASVRYGSPTVNVEPYRDKDNQGAEHEITHFWSNGPAWPQASGNKVKKDGSLGPYRQNIRVKIPGHVKEALDGLNREGK